MRGPRHSGAPDADRPGRGHLLISERTNDGLERSPDQWFRRYNAAAPDQGGARKTEALKPRAWLDATREDWAEQTNQALERAGHAIRIDHRSYAEQGIERLPGVHLGPDVLAMEAQGIETEQGAEARRRAQVNAQLAALTAHNRRSRSMSERDQSQSVSRAVQELSAKVATWEIELAAWPPAVGESVGRALETAAQEREAAQQRAQARGQEQARQLIAAGQERAASRSGARVFALAGAAGPC